MAVFHRSEPVLAEVPHHRPAAIAGSILGHAALILVLLFLGRYAVEKEQDTEPVRLVFVEPAPPPKLGAPDGGAAAAREAAVAPEPEPAPPPAAMEYHPQPALYPKPAPVPVPKDKPKPVAKAVPKPKAAEPVQAKTDLAGDAANDGTGTSTAPRGVAEGSAAGVEGGLVGGQVGGLGSEIVPVRQAAVPPTIAHRVMPTYPEAARMRGIEGQVMIEAVIARDGSVEPGVKVVQSVPALDDAAVDAFQRWRFTPARDASGNALRVILQAPVRFVLR